MFSKGTGGEEERVWLEHLRLSLTAVGDSQPAVYGRVGGVAPAVASSGETPSCTGASAVLLSHFTPMYRLVSTCEALSWALEFRAKPLQSSNLQSGGEDGLV